MHRRKSPLASDNRRLHSLWFCLFLTPAAFSACSPHAVTSSHVSSDELSVGKSSGVYFLPKVLLQVKLERTDTFRVCEKKRDASGQEADIDPGFQAKELIRIDHSLSYVDKSTVPDHEYAYSISYDESVWSKDKLTIDISSDGLLDKIHFKAEDTTDKIILKITELAKEAAKAFVSFGEVSAGVPEIRALQVGETCIKARIEISKPLTVLTTNFDPLSRVEIEGVNAAIKAVAANTDLSIDIQQSRVSVVDKRAPPSSCATGMCYRPAKPYDLILFSNGVEYDRTSLLLPAKDTIVEIDITRATFVEKTTTIDFENGLLKQVDIDKPSEALEIVSLPVDILKAIVAIPTELIQLKIDTTNKEKNLIEAQKNHIDTQKKLLEAQEELRKKKEQLDADKTEAEGITQ